MMASLKAKFNNGQPLTSRVSSLKKPRYGHDVRDLVFN